MKFQSEKPLHLPKSKRSYELHQKASTLLVKITDSFKSIKIPSIQPPKTLLKNTETAFKKFKTFLFKNLVNAWAWVLKFVEKTRCLGFTAEMNEYEKRKLGIFNQLNLFQIITGLIAPLVVIFTSKMITIGSAFVLITPSLLSITVLYLNKKHKTEIALLCYFILYPFFTCLAYVGGMNLGVDLFFILYGILSVFFLKEIGYIAFCIGFSMVNYFMLAVVLKFYRYELETSHPFFYMLNQLLGILFIFYGLYLIKKENNDYQASLLSKNDELVEMNEEVRSQKEKVAEKVKLLEEQAIQLNEVDAFKTRLFSIVSHDLKNPMYALRNLFLEIQDNRVPAGEIKKMVPHIIKDLNYTTGLMDNILHWAKSQMHAGSVIPQAFDVTGLINEIIQQHRLQAEIKGININCEAEKPIIIYADKDMISLVIRNLLANAIKFTPENGLVSIGVNTMNSCVEIFVMDSGEGMDQDTMTKINSSNYYSTKGTSNEPGTGLGLMLCKEFLIKNKGQMHIESTPGEGSTFSFTLPLAS